MKLGCCTNLLATDIERVGIEAAQNIFPLGFDYIELPLAQIMELSDDKFDDLKIMLRSKGIKIKACNNFIPANIKLTGEEVNYNEGMDYVERALSRAEELGAKVVVFGSAGARNVAEGFPYNKALEQIFNFLEDISEIAKRHDITIAIEHLTKKESNIINSVEEALKIVMDLEKENIKLLVDYFHI
ncbi:MAG: sugar phosphate isomerase/epimerase family protein [Thermovenabulum sp.]|uniref:sugar phosphate isomerase/epimerase family protein n=1 Tax=Thermovenabulum sp. TaxID=3100335 RepID=UPI003C7ECE48